MSFTHSLHSLVAHSDFEKPQRCARKGGQPVTAEVIETPLATCLVDRHFVDWRDWALLLVTGALGRRRRSEVAGLRGEDLMHEVPVPRRSEDPVSRKVTKTRSGSGGLRPPRSGRCKKLVQAMDLRKS